jgi:hypothetical protein
VKKKTRAWWQKGGIGERECKGKVKNLLLSTEAIKSQHITIDIDHWGNMILRNELNSYQ